MSYGRMIGIAVLGAAIGGLLFTLLGWEKALGYALGATLGAWIAEPRLPGPLRRFSPTWWGESSRKRDPRPIVPALTPVFTCIAYLLFYDHAALSGWAIHGWLTALGQPLVDILRPHMASLSPNPIFMKQWGYPFPPDHVAHHMLASLVMGAWGTVWLWSLTRQSAEGYIEYYEAKEKTLKGLKSSANFFLFCVFIALMFFILVYFVQTEAYEGYKIYGKGTVYLAIGRGCTTLVVLGSFGMLPTAILMKRLLRRRQENSPSGAENPPKQSS